MARTTINISLPVSMRDYVAFRADDGYGSVSDYVRELIRNDQKNYLDKLDAAAIRLPARTQHNDSAKDRDDVNSDGYLDLNKLFQA